MKILITGSTGMVGRNIVDVLAETSHEILSPSREMLDLFDERATLQFLEKTQPDFIIHCAGKVGGIQANISDPLGFFIENFDIGRNLVLSAYKVGIPRLLNLGSSCMYPCHAPNPLSEHSILSGTLEPTNEGYALAKISTQRLCHYIVKKNPTLKYKTLIPCNLYGRYDKFDLMRAHLIPAAIHKIHSAKYHRENSVTIWGDGTARREFLYTGDLTDFILRKLTCFDDWPETMNLGAEKDHTILEYYQKIGLIIGYGGNFDFDFQKPVGMTRKLVNSDFQKSLGWFPSTSLEEGIQKTYEYYLEHKKNR